LTTVSQRTPDFTGHEEAPDAQEGGNAGDEHGRPLVSFIIPIYNSGKTIGRVLESIAEIRFDTRKVEVIFVYFPTQDEGLGIVEGLIEAHRRDFESMTLLKRDDRRANVARNMGIRASRGAYLFLLNDDVLVSPDSVANAISIFSQDEKVGVVTFPYVFEPPRIYEQAMFFRFFGRVAKTKVFALGCSMVKREVFARAGLINERMGPPLTSNDDYEISARVAKAGFAVTIDGRTVMTDIGSLKEKEAAAKSTRGSARSIAGALAKYVRYDTGVGADTYDLVLRPAPAAWKVEPLFYVAIFLLGVATSFYNLVYGVLYVVLVSAASILYFRASRPVYALYSLLVVCRRISRSCGYVVRRGAKALMKVL
jgi:glycosyltransferase involved in cell wall biosynthesis